MFDRCKLRNLEAFDRVPSKDYISYWNFSLFGIGFSLPENLLEVLRMAGSVFGLEREITESYSQR